MSPRHARNARLAKADPKLTRASLTTLRRIRDTLDDCRPAFARALSSPTEPRL